MPASTDPLEKALLSGLESLRASAHAAGLSWRSEGEDPQAASRLAAYLNELQRWNRAYSLTAITGTREMVPRHVMDSLAVAPWVHGRVLDAGTGAGLPGVPLAVMDPGLEVTLLDSTGKKVRFLRQVKRALGLTNIEPAQGRLEAYGTDPAFDIIISRAFSSLTEFATAARHLMAPATRLMAMKGRRPDAELGVLPEWIEATGIEELEVPGLHEDRHLVIMSLT